MATSFFSDNRIDFERVISRLAPAAGTIERYIAAQDSFTGYCALCDRIVAFKVGPSQAANGWISLRESLVCPGCGLSGRGRLAISLVREAVADLPQERTHIFERITHFYGTLLKHGVRLQGSEYVGAECAPGSLHKLRGTEVRHEDMLRLSYADGALDFVCHFDVLEHVPDFRRALCECARVLRPGGQLLFTVPFFGADEHLVRAEMIDGEIVHHLPPEYHRNPVEQTASSLVFFVPGWPLLDDLRAAGFSRAEIGLHYDAFEGIVSDNNPAPAGHMWPVFFRALKR
ncbi:class I SAM-dependent methyltransferase [Terricaulis sp.]|uniref:class I SAM-dependent methyltransferase n=1 Tax=Terricaulis sp. TaxID=2768686 RepID=UPI0037842D19